MIATSPPDLQGGIAFTVHGEQEGPGFRVDAEHPVARFRITAEVTLTEAARGEEVSDSVVVSLAGVWSEGDPEGRVALWVGDEADPRWSVSLGAIPVDGDSRASGLGQYACADRVVGDPCARSFVLEAFLENEGERTVDGSVEANVEAGGWIAGETEDRQPIEIEEEAMRFLFRLAGCLEAVAYPVEGSAYGEDSDCVEGRACEVEVEATLSLLKDAFVELRPCGHATIWTEMPQSADFPDDLPSGAWVKVGVEVAPGG